MHWCFAYTELSADVVADLGFDPERITVVNNAIDTAQMRRDMASLRPGANASLRRDLELGDVPVGVFLGTFRPDKRIHVLLEASEPIHAVHPEFRLLLVGSGSGEDELRVRAEHEPWLQ